jgi:hypothetical protein
MKNILELKSRLLADTIFVEDTKPFCLCKVLKIDAAYVMVKMQSKIIVDSSSQNGDSSMEAQSLLDSCRILPKNQLQVRFLLVLYISMNNFLNYF